MFHGLNQWEPLGTVSLVGSHCITVLCYRGQTVISPDHRPGTLLGTLQSRGRASQTDLFAIRSRRGRLVRADQIEPFRNPAAP